MCTILQAIQDWDWCVVVITVNVYVIFNCVFVCVCTVEYIIGCVTLHKHGIVRRESGGFH